MKQKGLKHFLVLAIGLLLILPAALAQTEEETLQELEASAGITPDSPWYFIDTFFDRFADPAELEQEKVGEYAYLIEQQQYEAYAAELAELGEHVESYIASFTPSAAETFGDLHEMEESALVLESAFEYLAEQVPEEFHEGTQIGEFHENTAGVVNAVIEQRETLIGRVAEEEGRTELEVELALEDVEQENGLADRHSEEVEETSEEIEQQLEDISEILSSYAEAGRDVPPATAQLLTEARAHLESAELKLDTGFDGAAFGQVTAAERLVRNAERILERAEEVDEAENEELGNEAREFEERRLAKEQQLVEQFEQALDNIPAERREQVEKAAGKAEKAIELAGKLRDVFDAKYGGFLSEGKTPAEATQVLMEEFKQEYENAYGEPLEGKGFIPPGVELGEVPPPSETAEEAPEGEGETASTTASTESTAGPKFQPVVKAPFVEEYKYEDPATGFKYEFKSDGWEYETPLGMEYKVKWDENALPKREFEYVKEHTVEIETSKGKVEYKYYPTGYEVRSVDGTVERKAYDPGEWKVATGGEVNIKFTGFEVKEAVTGKKTNYDYDPNAATFVSSEGFKQFPVYFQKEAWVKAGAEGIPAEGTAAEGAAAAGTVTTESRFVFEHKGEKWEYDPAANQWASGDNAQRYTPQGKVVFDRGEQKYEITTGIGSPQQQKVSWKFEEGKGWVSEGEGGNVVYNPNKGVLESATGEKIAFQPRSGLSFLPTASVVDALKEGKTGKEITNKENFVFDTEGNILYDEYGPRDRTSYEAERSGVGSARLGHYFNPETSAWKAIKSEAEYQDALEKGWTYSPPGAGAGTYAKVGTNVDYAGKQYFVDDKLGWAVVNEKGEKVAVAPPPGQPGSQVGAPSSSAGGYYSGGVGGQAGGIVGHYKDASGSWQAVTDISTVPAGAEYSPSGSTGPSESTGGTYSSWSSSEGGYAGGSYSGSYSGGPTPGTEGSAPSGGSWGGDGGDSGSGDGGGSGGGDGGGSGGGDGGGDGGGGGYAIREIRPARELHPVTRFLVRYLGLDR